MIGLCAYYDGRLESSIQNFNKVLEKNPWHASVLDIHSMATSIYKKLELGGEYHSERKFTEAYSQYTQALSIDPKAIIISAMLFFKRAMISLETGKVDKIIDDCSSSLELNAANIQALLMRARCYYDKENYEAAVDDYRRALQIEYSNLIEWHLQEAEAALGISRCCKILNIPKTASSRDLKGAYHKCALEHHPDKHMGETSSKIKFHSEQFLKANEAYKFLTTRFE